MHDVACECARAIVRRDAQKQLARTSLNDCIDSNFNIDDLPTDRALQVKVVIIDETGKPTTTNPQEEESKQIV